MQVIRLQHRSVEPEETYQSLVAELCPAPIESEEHYDKVADQLETLVDAAAADGEQEPGGARMIVLLSTLIEAWDNAHNPDPEMSPAEMLAFMLESTGTSKSELSRLIGVKRQELNGLDTGERDFSNRIAQLVSSHFGQPVGLYLRKDTSPSAA